MPILNSGEKRKYTNTAIKIGENIIKGWIIENYHNKISVPGTVFRSASLKKICQIKLEIPRSLKSWN